MYIEGLDEFDNKLLTILENDARLTYSEIGNQIGLSRVSVKTRMDNLEKRGIIVGYTAKINQTNLPEGRRFFIDVVTDPNKFEEVVDYFARVNIIHKVYAVTGGSNFRAEGYASSKGEYESFMMYVKKHLYGVTSITIQDVQYTIKDTEAGLDYVKLYEREKEQ